jgi:hypothetical protein
MHTTHPHTHIHTPTAHSRLTHSHTITRIYTHAHTHTYTHTHITTYRLFTHYNSLIHTHYNSLSNTLQLSHTHAHTHTQHVFAQATCNLAIVGVLLRSLRHNEHAAESGLDLFTAFGLESFCHPPTMGFRNQLVLNSFILLIRHGFPPRLSKVFKLFSKLFVLSPTSEYSPQPL